MSITSAKLVAHSDITIALTGMLKCYGNNPSLQSLVRAVKRGHLSLLEHVSVTLDICCSQKLLAQISRHRHFSFTVESSRVVNMANQQMQTELSDNPEIRAITKEATDVALSYYQKLVDAGASFEEASMILPLASTVTFSMTGNLRCWIEYLSKRLCHRASTEHKLLAKQIFAILKAEYPEIVTADMIGICESCKEPSCDFTSHKVAPKHPIRLELE